MLPDAVRDAGREVVLPAGARETGGVGRVDESEDVRVSGGARPDPEGWLGLAGGMTTD